jgi:hypothetical protein
MSELALHDNRPRRLETASAVASKLCDRCSGLGLSAERFLIQDDRPSDARPSVRSLQLVNERYPLGTVHQIRETASTCQLCDLVSHTVPNPPAAHVEGAVCHLVWEIDGRTSIDPEDAREQRINGGKRTRRLRVHWNHPDLEQYGSYLVLAAPAMYDHSDVDYRGLLNSETEFLGRRVGRAENKRNLIRELLRLCEGHHGLRCTQKLGIEGEFHETLMEPYFGVIDIENDKLVPLPFTESGENLKFEPYATVSYVWGDDDGHRQHMTTMANIQSRRKSGGLASVIPVLPKTLQEAIRLVHALGIRYIWIDALCIVQDSSHSWNLNARAMHLIYGNAVFTLCAADGLDARTGLVAMDEHQQPQQHVATCADGVHLLLHQSPEASIKASQWNKRAWTFQERLLSRRCLIFTGGRIYFQCRSTVMSEDIFADRNGRGWSLDLLQSPLQMLSQLKVRALWFYTHCVPLYTRRQLHEPFDILSAFSGMCKLMEYTLQSPFVFGLPSSHFDLALLWQQTGPASRLHRPRHRDEPKYKDMKFPSWSWCGWESAGVEYAEEMTHGCLTDIRSWLSDHTWIDWHIRDGHGRLRRVWDKSWAEEDKSSNPTWKGYSIPDREDADHDDDYNDSASLSESPSESSQRRVRYTPREGSPSPVRRHPRRPRSKSPAGLTRLTRVTREFDNTLSIVDRKTADARWRPGQASRPQRGQEIYLTDRRRRNADHDCEYDNYGRPSQSPSMLASLHIRKREFTHTLPEDPYNVRKVTESLGRSIGSGAGSGSEFPDQPFLQFFTWKTWFHVVPVTAQSRSHGVDGGQGGLGPGLRRCHITDQRGDKCGSIVVDAKWLREKQLTTDIDTVEGLHSTTANGPVNGLLGDGLRTGTSTTEFEFIALSEAKDFTKDEFPDWTYYIPRERTESEWDLFFVLLVEHYPVEGFYRRVALGKVFKAAFALSNDEWSEIILG